MENNTPTFNNLAEELRGRKGKKINKNTLLLTIFLLILVALLALGAYFYMNNQAQKDQSSGGKLSEKQIKDLLEEVGSKMDLPENETPTIATITDVTKLEDQPFFRKAKNGDKLIVYGSTQKAILYRPSTHKIIEVAQLNINPQSLTPTQAPASPTPIKSGPTTAPLSPTNSPTPTVKVASPTPTKAVITTPSPTVSE